MAMHALHCHVWPLSRQPTPSPPSQSLQQLRQIRSCSTPRHAYVVESPGQAPARAQLPEAAAPTWPNLALGSCAVSKHHSPSPLCCGLLFECGHV
ncbi:hypothetical protein BS50DRAFT_580097 [Corynespora cassiicola Philippines]|uniref:Uncharacterized protein n=1 Tax=Corynespora cassiicola Philippines TaxID=1448308 RepID=A0A2T2N151_CORCC|nr:hypothetical protein BS50DRAFT_263707 [Corynespora cassiicola Philippines]PSN59294.1 hypothetical protein BS50DRAFT_580097 [Corynespora cassiicola Philippines]